MELDRLLVLCTMAIFEKKSEQREKVMTDIYLEVGAKKIFACVLEWPGWCRFGKSEAEAQQALIDSQPRYRVIAQRAELDFAPGAPVVVERVPGDATTDWGAPSSVTAFDIKPSDKAQAERRVALLRAAWTVMDETIATSPAELRKGPRGGGRERDQVASHVIEAERAYARKIGVQHKSFPLTDLAALTTMREAITDVLSKPSDGSPLTPNGWPATYAIRRITWHVVDHIWEIEDRRA
jgi:hypothetical protein